MVMLGAMMEKSTLPIERSMLAELISKGSPAGFRQVNLDAFDAGVELVRRSTTGGGCESPDGVRGHIDPTLIVGEKPAGTRRTET